MKREAALSRAASRFLFHGMCCVEIEVEFEDADARLAEEAELASEGVFRDELTCFGFGDVALAGDARNLELGGGGGDFGIETGAGSGEEIDRNRRVWIFGVEFGGVGFDAIDELVIGRREI